MYKHNKRGYEQKIETFVKDLQKEGPRDTQEFEKVEIPNSTVSKSLAKIEKAYKPIIVGPHGEKKYLGGSEEDKNAVTDKDVKNYIHWNDHTTNSQIYSNLKRAGVQPGDYTPNNRKLHDGYEHYNDNVDSDKALYDTLMKITGGNGEHNK